MNHAHFGTWVLDRVEDLVTFGVPRIEAESLMLSVERGGLQAELAARDDAQFLIDFRRLGSSVMAARQNCTQHAVRKRRTKLLNRTHELRARLRTE